MPDDQKENDPRKPTLPPGYGPKETGPEEASAGKASAGKPSTKKPSTKKPSTKKASLPPGAAPNGHQPAGKKSPALPPGKKSPALPPGKKKPTLPPGFSGDGGPSERSGGGPSSGGGLTRKDFASDQDVRWCPGCGDYAILAAVQRLLPTLEVPKEDHVFISGIGCSGRFPYYMDTYGMHSIHGRAPAIATGLKASRPELHVWIVTGDGDALSIGAGHLMHILRRNVDVQMLLFNNQIYGLTKGQYSPTSERGKVTKSSPHGSIDAPFNPVAVALGADASFVARTMDREAKHMGRTLEQAHAHRGAAFVEIYQNCNIFNDGAFFEFTENASRSERALFLEDGQPMTYAGGRKGLRLDGLRLQSIDLEGGRWSKADCLVHDAESSELAHLLGRLFWQEDLGSSPGQALPRPFGVLYRAERPTYEELLHTQIEGLTERKGPGELDALLHAGDTWTIE